MGQDRNTHHRLQQSPSPRDREYPGQDGISSDQTCSGVAGATGWTGECRVDVESCVRRAVVDRMSLMLLAQCLKGKVGWMYPAIDQDLFLLHQILVHCSSLYIAVMNVPFSNVVECGST